VDVDLVPALFEPSHCGPWSREVEEAIRELVEEGLVKRYIEPGGDESPAEVYELIPAGMQRAKRALEELQKREDWKDIEVMFKLATKAPLMNLLAFVYMFHPRYAERSKIRDRVKRYAKRYRSLFA